jgi:hypothetical protein
MEMIQKQAVLHCIYQLIASADGSVIEERDSSAINFALTELELTSIYVWDSALHLNPHDCFMHVAMLSDENKQHFKSMLLTIAEMGGNRDFRISCANSLFELCRVK